MVYTKTIYFSTEADLKAFEESLRPIKEVEAEIEAEQEPEATE
jgi:hypothetical protein